jgi:Protein of unknown function (DUF1579)
MNTAFGRTRVMLACTVAASLALVMDHSPAQEPKDQLKVDMAAMMAKARKYTQPGRNHEILERFIGKWNTETRIHMGSNPTPAEKGTAEFSWLMKGRWLKSETNGAMMGMPFQSFTLMGYDIFKQNYVATTVSSIDTSMIHVEGKMDPGGKALLMYGVMDEYTTGEHDKSVKNVWRFPAPDKMILEIHDLAIGENNTKVVEITFTKQAS